MGMRIEIFPGFGVFGGFFFLNLILFLIMKINFKMGRAWGK